MIVLRLQSGEMKYHHVGPDDTLTASFGESVGAKHLKRLRGQEWECGLHWAFGWGRLAQMEHADNIGNISIEQESLRVVGIVDSTLQNPVYIANRLLLTTHPVKSVECTFLDLLHGPFWV